MDRAEIITQEGANESLAIFFAPFEFPNFQQIGQILELDWIWSSKTIASLRT